MGCGVGVRNGLRKIVAGHSLAVVAFKVERHALGKAGAPQRVVRAGHQRLHHAHDLGAFFVNRDGVEVADLHIAVGTHGVRHRAGIFRKLGSAQHAHVLDALDGPARGIKAQVL